ncbi:MAG: AAA domain-containing protein [Desulfovibrionaceae bacterium]|nr:AAA domain-containing protein [Desulfovibrionaceae bacterium]
MNPDNHLIFVNGKDRTQGIHSCSIFGDKVEIVFTSDLNKPYSYNKSNAEIYQNPEKLLPDQAIVFKDGKHIFDMQYVLVFDHHIRIVYGKESKPPKVFRKDEVQLVRNGLADQCSNDCLEYLKRVAAECVDKKDPDNESESFLKKQYDRLSFVREDSVLAAYLHGKPPSQLSSKQPTPIYPFSFNLSQKAAVEQSMCHSLTLIEGPPGTGKTQTILNLVANSVMNGEVVAVVSNNNAATSNVLEKLEKAGLGFIAAPLGKKDNKSAFIGNQPKLPDMSDWSMGSQEEELLRGELHTLFADLNEMLKKKNDLSLLKREQDALEVEISHYIQYHGDAYAAAPSLKTFRKIDAKKALQLWLTCEYAAERGERFSFWKRIKNFFRFGLADASFYSLFFGDMVLVCQKHFYEQKRAELQARITQLSDALSGFSFDKKKEEYSQWSMQLFKAFLHRKYTARKRKIYTLDDLWKNSSAVVQDYPVILSTTFALRSSLSDNFIYNTVIMDEASQINLTAGALALACAKKAVIVGDLKQLQNVVKGEHVALSNRIFQEFSLPEPYRYATNSLLSSLSGLFPDIPNTQLREHYRCHPKIIEFCNKKFYKNKLIILTEPDPKDNKKPLLVYKTVPGNHARGNINRRQVDVIENEIFRDLNLNPDKDCIGITAPFVKQANVLKQEFDGTKIKADTVDKFQGREHETIIFSTVANDYNEFVDNANRINVAVSRAQRQMVLLIHGNEDTRDSNINDLVQYIQYNNMDVVHSEIRSVFDYLYKCYAEERREFFKDRERPSNYDSENLMYDLIYKILQQERYAKYTVNVHYPLKKLLRPGDQLTNEQRKYAEHENTHVDLLICNQFGNVPVLGVEVDGVAFHEKGSRQEERDRLKDSIFEALRIPLRRFRTDESGEREKLEKALEGISS